MCYDMSDAVLNSDHKVTWAVATDRFMIAPARRVPKAFPAIAGTRCAATPELDACSVTRKYKATDATSCG